MATMRQLAATADVFASTYRPAVNERFGLLPEQLAAASECGIVYMSANAYGHSGPWKDRPGFDQNGQVASGFAMAEGQGGAPKFSPVFYLADLITGYFAAAGMMAAPAYRRAIEGGLWQVKLFVFAGKAAAPCAVEELDRSSTPPPRQRCQRPTPPIISVEIGLDRCRVRRAGRTSLAQPPAVRLGLTLTAIDLLVPDVADSRSWPSATS